MPEPSVAVENIVLDALRKNALYGRWLTEEQVGEVTRLPNDQVIQALEHLSAEGYLALTEGRWTAV